MPDYKKMYFELAGKVADAVEFLIAAQRNGENRFMEDVEPPILQLSKKIKIWRWFGAG